MTAADPEYGYDLEYDDDETEEGMSLENVREETVLRRAYESQAEEDGGGSR